MRAKIRKFAAQFRKTMVINIGDKVRFLNDVGGGTITRVLNPKTVMVQTDDGFEVPTSVTDLIKAEPESEKKMAPKDDVAFQKPELTTKSNKNAFAAQLKQISAKEVVNAEPELLQLAIVPQKRAPGESEYQFHLINEDKSDILYVLHSEQNGLLRKVEKGTLESGLEVELCSYTQAELLERSALHLQVLFYGNNEYSYPDPLCFTLSLGGINLQQKQLFKINDYFEQPALLLPVIDNRFTRATYLTGGKVNLKPKDSSAKAVGAIKEDADIEEIDLHIDQIIDNFREMTPGEIMDVQMARFRTALEGAIHSNTKRIVFIHGVGNGKLKYELRKALDQDYPRLSYQDASFAEYGFGATMVMLKK
jgi:hypothetical protein